MIANCGGSSECSTACTAAQPECSSSLGSSRLRHEAVCSCCCGQPSIVLDALPHSSMMLQGPCRHKHLNIQYLLFSEAPGLNDRTWRSEVSSTFIVRCRCGLLKTARPSRIRQAHLLRLDFRKRGLCRWRSITITASNGALASCGGSHVGRVRSP